MFSRRADQEYLRHGMLRIDAYRTQRSGVSKNRLLATAAADGYAVEGSIFVAGAAVQWLRDKLGLLATQR